MKHFGCIQKGRDASARLLCFATLVLACSLPPSAALAQAPPVQVLTLHNNNSRTGSNINEVILNTSNVNAAQFGKLFTQTVDGLVVNQPLYVPNVIIPGKGTHNVVFIATKHDSVYAFDADDNDNDKDNDAPLWKTSFIDPDDGITTIFDPNKIGTPSGERAEFGILGTPVIDMTTETLYVVALTKEVQGTQTGYFYRLHALDIHTGHENFGGPVLLTTNAVGNGTGSSAGLLPFNAQIHQQRPALLLSQGIVYVCWASYGDHGNFHGWVMGYDAKTLQQVASFCATPNGAEGGIWMAGGGPVADDDGYIYITTGNGSFNAAKHNYGDSFLKLNPDLTVADYFTPFNQLTLANNDLDIGSSGPMLLHGWDLLVGGGKESKTYVISTDSMGHYNTTSDSQIVQSFKSTVGHFHGTPAFWDSPVGPLLYVWTENDNLKSFKLVNGKFNTTPYAKSAMAVPTGTMPGGFISISANGHTPGTGIAWATHNRIGDANPQLVPGILRAFDAVTLKELWNSRQVAGDDMGTFGKYIYPTIANGKVYLGTYGSQLVVYGIKAIPAPTIAPNGGVFLTPTTVTLSEAAFDPEIYYTLDGTDPDKNATLYTGPFTVNPSTTVKAVAYALNRKSPISVAQFRVGNSLQPVADAYVCAGSSADANFGSSAKLAVKKVSSDSVSNYNRASYLKFDLTNLASAPANVTLNLTVSSASVPANGMCNLKVYGLESADSSWAESTLTWNNAPGLNRANFTGTGTLLASKKVTLKPGTLSLDVTGFIAAHIGQIVTLQLIDEATDNALLVFPSRESATGQPALIFSF